MDQFNHRSGQRSPHMLTRVIIGGIALGMDVISKRLTEWESEFVQENVTSENEFSHSEESPPEGEGLSPLEGASTDVVRLAVIGMIFEAQDQLSSVLRKAGDASLKVQNYTDRAWLPISQSKLFAPFSTRWDKLIQHGENKVDSWIERGRLEQAASLSLAEFAVQDTTDEVIDTLAVHPGVRELVERQSSGFAAEFLEELRERAVSLDTLVEKIIRSMFHKTPRSKLLILDAENRIQKPASKTPRTTR